MNAIETSSVNDDNHSRASRQPFSANSLRPDHEAEWFKGSGVSETLIYKSVSSLDDPQDIKQLLNWKAYAGKPGWYVRGVDPQAGQYRDFGQFKPDEPIPNKDGKLTKYFSPKGSKSEAIFLAVTLNEWLNVCKRYGIYPDWTKDYDSSKADLGFWQWVLKHPEIPIVLTEGAKKAGCLLSNGYVAICLTGVWNGQRDKRELIPDLVPFVVSERQIKLVFDADIVTKSEVQKALQCTGKLLEEAKATVGVITWDIGQGKGCDDYLVTCGIEAFEILMDSAVTYGEWVKGLEKQFSKNEDDTENNYKGKSSSFVDKIASEIAKDYRDKLAFNNESSTWMRYEADNLGSWSVETQEFIEKIVCDILKAKNISYTSFSYVASIIKALRSELIVRKWVQADYRQFLPFKNGVLEIATGKLTNHSPGHRFTWTLPREHNPLASDWLVIDSWLNEFTSNDERIKRILLCYLNAILKGRSDIEKFLYLTGEGGTGKSTFIRLCTELVGDRNTYSSSLREWEGSRFETANAYQKRLLVFPDEAKQPSGIENLKKATGRDNIRNEQKGKTAFVYKFDGSIIVASNYPIFVGENSTALERRIITIPCKNMVPTFLRRDVSKELESCLDALTNYVLAIPDEEVTRTLQQTDNVSPAVIEQYWEDRLRTDSIAAWVNEYLIPAPLSQERTGTKDVEGSLYYIYCQYCLAAGFKSRSLNNFVEDLKSLLTHTLRWENVKSVTNGLFRGISGIRLRNEKIDASVPYPIEQLCYQQRLKAIKETRADRLDRPSPSTYTPTDTAKPLPDKDSYRLYIPNDTPKENEHELLNSVDSQSELSNLEKSDSSLSSLSKPIADNGSAMSTSLSTDRPSPSVTDKSLLADDLGIESKDGNSRLQSTTESTPSDEPLKVGDKVWWDDCYGHCEWANPFTITSIDGDRAMLDLIEKPILLSELRRP